MKKSNWKRGMTVLLAFCICLTSLPFVGAAEDLSFLSGMGLTVEQGTYVVGIPEKHPAGDVVNRLTDPTGATVRNANGTEVDSRAFVGTGYTLQARGKTLILVVKGDVTGDSLVQSADYLRLKGYMQAQENLTDAAIVAADTTGDGKLSSTDYL